MPIPDSNAAERHSENVRKKDHTTVIHGIKKIEAEMETNSELASKLDIIKKKINPI